jgi:hypothetical protein
MIKFKCPNCKKGLSVKEHLAGKTAKCPACAKPLKIPAPAPAPAPSAPQPDADELAMSVLQDKPAEAPAEEQKTIDFPCPQCDEPVQAPLDLAGKQMPCPHCRRIIKVPVPQKKDPNDWRSKPTGPSAARQTLEPKPLDGAWAAGSTAAHRESLEEAGALPEEKERITVRQWVVRIAVPLAVLVVVGSVVWWVYRNASQSKETRLVEGALKALQSKPLADRPDAQAVLHRAAGEYYLRTNKRGCVVPARAELGKANVALNVALDPKYKVPDGVRDLLLIELALTQVDLGGTQEEVQNGTRRSWVGSGNKKLGASDRGLDEDILQTLGQLKVREAQLLAARAVGRKLVARGQAQVAAALPPRLPNDLQPEAAAWVGLELFRSDPARAATAADLAFQTLNEPAMKGTPVPPSLVALCMLLNNPDLTKKLPPDAQNPAQADRPLTVLGAIEGLGLQGNADSARQLINKFSKPNQLQPRLVLAEALARQQPEAAKPDVQAALQLVDPKTSPWLVLRLIRVGMQTGLDEESLKQLQKLPNSIQDPGLQAWAYLEVMRGQVATMKDKAGADLYDPVDRAGGDKTAAAYLAREEWARHNARVSGGTLDEVKTWENEAYRPFGVVGAVLGGQDK